MSNIRFFGLGGLGENGKNLYCLDIDNLLFVLDAGVKYPSTDQYGVDFILPDFRYLVENKKRIAGLFLSHGHDQEIGAVVHILQEINIPIYGSNFTLSMVEDDLNEANMKLENYQFHRIEKKPISIGGIKITTFHTSHNIPESLGYVFETKDGNIIYTGDYTFDQNCPHEYETDYQALTEASEKKVLMLISESLGANKYGTNGDYFKLSHKLENLFLTSTNRIIFTIYSSDLRRIQRIIDMAVKYNKRVALIGRKTQRIVDIGVNLGYLKIPNNVLINLRYIDEKSDNNFSNLVVLITGIRHEPFFMLQRMIKKVDRLIHIEKTDTVVFMTSPAPAIEKMAARTYDMLAKVDVKMIRFSREDLESSHAYAEEIKMMYHITKPEFCIPVIGEYRHQYAHKEICKQLGYDEKNIIILENGEVASFVDGKYKGITDHIPTSEVILDGSVVGDVNQTVLREREALSSDGILITSVAIDAKKKKIVSGPELISKGFVYVYDNETLFLDIKKIELEILNKYLKGKYIVWNDLRNELKNTIFEYVKQKTKKEPMIVPVVISAEASE